MLRRSALSLTPVLLAAHAAAQQIPLATLTRTETQLTTNGPGPYTDLAVGAFRLGHPGRGAVLLRDGTLELCFQPAMFRHQAPAGGVGVTAIATIPALPTDRRDRLAALSAQGLHVLHLGVNGFVDATTVHTAWAGIVNVKACVLPYAGAPKHFVLGIAPSTVRVAALNLDTIVGVAQVPAAPGMTVLDAELVDWVAGGLPEVVVLTSHGTFVIDLATLSVAQQMTSTVTTAGFLTTLASGAALVQLTQQGSQWQVATLVPTGVAVASPLLTFAKPPIGIAGGRWNADEFQDLIVSTGEATRHVLFGDASGPQTDAAHRIDFADTTAPSDPQVDNLTAVVVDDVDHDSEYDVVLVNQANATLTVAREFRRQIVGNVDPELLTSIPDPTTGVSLHGVIGYDWLFFAPLVPTAWQIAAHDALGLRFTLPAETPATCQIYVTRYEVDPAGDADPATGVTYAFGLAEGDGSFADVVLLFPAALSTVSTNQPVAWWPGGQRFVLEYLLCETNGDGGFSWVGEPVCAMFGAKHAETHAPLDLKAAFELEDIGLPEHWVHDNLSMGWGAEFPHVTGSPDVPGDNRWVGYHPIVRRKSAKPVVPPTGIVQPMGNAKRS